MTRAAAAALALPGLRLGTPQQWRWLGVGVALAILLQYTLQWASHLPIWQRVVQRFIWWRQGGPIGGRPPPSALGTSASMRLPHTRCALSRPGQACRHSSRADGCSVRSPAPRSAPAACAMLR